MSSSRDAITVYISSFNKARYLPGAIQSVLDQTRMPDRLLIIDDASSDGSPEIIERYRAARPGLIRPILLKENIGIGAVRRLAIQQSESDLITYLDADDAYLPRKLELEEKALHAEPSAAYAYAYSNFAFVDTHGQQTAIWIEPGEPVPSGPLFEAIATYALPRGVCHRSELMRRDAILAAGSYEPGLDLYEDFDLKLRVARAHPAAAVETPLHTYRMHPGGLHRISYARHYDALEYVYAKNAPLIDSLEAEPRKRVGAGIDRVLSRHAWRTIKQSAAGEIELKPSQILRYARAAAAHQPRSLLVPKHPYRVARALTRF